MKKPQALDPEIAEFWAALESDEEFWVQQTLTDVAVDLHSLLAQAGLSRSSLAERIGKTPAYITKILRGDVNFTLRSLVLLARALHGRLHVRITHQDQSRRLVPTDGYQLADIHNDVPVSMHHSHVVARHRISACNEPRYDADVYCTA